jgi:hypothetical protein
MTQIEIIRHVITPLHKPSHQIYAHAFGCRKKLSRRKPHEGCNIDKAPSSCVPSGSSNLGPVPCHRFEAHPLGELVHPSALKPPPKVLALTHVKGLKLVTAFHNGFNPDASDPHTSPDGQLTKLEEVQPNASKRRV